MFEANPSVAGQNLKTAILAAIVVPLDTTFNSVSQRRREKVVGQQLVVKRTCMRRVVTGKSQDGQGKVSIVFQAIINILRGPHTCTCASRHIFYTSSCLVSILRCGLHDLPTVSQLGIRSCKRTESTVGNQVTSTRHGICQQKPQQ